MKQKQMGITLKNPLFSLPLLIGAALTGSLLLLLGCEIPSLADRQNASGEILPEAMTASVFPTIAESGVCAQSESPCPAPQDGTNLVRGFPQFTYLPLVLRSSTPVSNPYLLEGSVLLNQGSCCAGGVAGQTITLTAWITATSPVANVTHMRLASRLADGCFSEAELALQPWIPYLTLALIPLEINQINWIGFYASVQFRDAAGYLSHPVCDDISIEGIPPPP
jgi:hypothetical protein